MRRTASAFTLLTVALLSTANCQAAPMFELLTTFGGGDGVILDGDGSESYLTTGSTERGIGYNPTTNRVYVPTRGGGNRVIILNGDTGAEIQAVTLPGGISGGIFAINQMAVDENGVIYLANLTTGTSATAPFKVYRFASEADLIAGNFSTAFSGELTTGHRYGDTIDLRGTGTSTQIVVPSGSANSSLAILTTADGLNFMPTVFSTAGLMTPANDAGPARQGVAFGDGDVLWGKEAGERLFRATFDLNTAMLTATNTYSTAEFPSAGGALEFLPGHDLLVFNSHADPRQVRVYDVADLSAGPQLLQSFNLGSSASDLNVAGALTNYANGRIYSLQSNNGILAIVIPEPGALLLGTSALLGGIGLRRRRINNA